MTFYLVYTVAPVVEVNFLPGGYVLGHEWTSGFYPGPGLGSSEYPAASVLLDKHGVPESTIRRRTLGAADPTSEADAPLLPPQVLLQRRRNFPADLVARHRALTTFHARKQRSSLRKNRFRRCLPRSGTRKSPADGGPVALDPGEEDGERRERVRLVSPMLYCELCRVKLNAAGQAKQHYAGKLHAKKLKLATTNKNNNNSSNNNNKNKPETEADNRTSPEDAEFERSLSAANSSPTSSGRDERRVAAPIVITDPLIYCKVCGISFNSDKQSRQHYRGKLHAKKQRLANHLNRCAARGRARAIIGETTTTTTTAPNADGKENFSSPVVRNSLGAT